MTILKLNFKMLFSDFQFQYNNRAVTLLELLIVLMIIGILVTAAVKTMDVSLQRSRFNSTVKELENLSWAIAGNPDLISGGKRSDFGYVGDVGVLPPTLRELYENFSNYSTWHGPYIKPTFQESPQSYMIDAWGDTYIYPDPNTIVETASVYIRSYGGGSIATPNTWLTINIANHKSDLFSNDVTGNVYDAYGSFIGTYSMDTAYISLICPRLGRMETLHTRCDTSRGPRYIIPGVPVGNHLLRATAVHHGTAIILDSVEKTVCVYPRVGATDINIRFPAIRFGPDQ